MAFNKQKVACTDTPWAKKEEFFHKILKDLTKEPLFYHGQMLCVACNVLKTFCIVIDR